MVARWLSALAVLLCAVMPARATAHPLHNSYAQVRIDPATRLVDVTIKAFADDFARHIGGPAGGPPGGSVESRAATYVASAFQLNDASGKRIPLKWCGWSRTGDQYTMCLRGTATSDGSGWHVRNAVLMDLFHDQLNIARVTLRSRESNLLFRPSTSTQVLPPR